MEKTQLLQSQIRHGSPFCMIIIASLPTCHTCVIALVLARKKLIEFLYLTPSAIDSRSISRENHVWAKQKSSNQKGKYNSLFYSRLTSYLKRIGGKMKLNEPGRQTFRKTEFLAVCKAIF